MEMAGREVRRAAPSLALVKVTRRCSCRWVRRRLTRVHEHDPVGALSPSQTDRMMAHLARCPRCLQAVREVRSVAGALARIALRRRTASEVSGVLIRALLAVGENA